LDASKFKIYVNGANVTDTGDVSVLGTQGNISPTAVSVGKDTFFPTDIFKGKIDDVRFFNRALTAAEVKQLYKLGTTKIVQ
jgi:hypothetical protein